MKADDENAEFRGYRLWPFGRYVIRQAGHDGVRKLVTGKYPEADVQALYKQFALSLLTSDRALAQVLPQLPPVLEPTGMGPPTPVESGWAHLNVAEMLMSPTISDPETMPIYSKRITDAGRHSFPWLGSPRPMSVGAFAFKIDGLPPSADPQAADAPALIVRRESMDTRELVWVMPAMENVKAIDRAGSANLVQGAGVAVLTRKRIEQKDGKPLYIVAGLVNPWMTPVGQEAGMNGSSVCIYRLAPPKDPAVKADGDSTKMRLTWTRPDLGGGAFWPWPRNVFCGYRVFGKDKAGSVVTITDLSFDPKATGNAIPIDPDATEVTLAAAKVGEFDPIGVASVEATVKDASGQLLVSEIAWLTAEGIVEGTYGLPAGTYKENSNNPFELGGDWKPVVGATVTLTYTLAPRQPKTLTATTDKDGRFVFRGVPAGAEFTASAGNYKQAGTTPVPVERVKIWLGEADPSRTIEVKHIKSTN